MNKVTECKKQIEFEQAVGSMWKIRSGTHDEYSSTFMVTSRSGHYVNLNSGFRGGNVTYNFADSNAVYEQVFCVTIERKQ